MHTPPHSTLDAGGLRVAIVVSRYHETITDVLCKGAVDTFTRAGGAIDDLRIVTAPGAFELTAVCRAFADQASRASGGQASVDGIVTIGCIIRGDTTHDQHLAQAIAQGLTAITVETGMPIAFGVLTCQTHHQARERAGGEKGNKGEEAMAAAIETIRTLQTIKQSNDARCGAPAR